MGPDNRESSVGPVIGTIIILAVIILGGLYFWSERSKNVVPDQTATSTAAAAASDTELTSLTTQGSADDTTSIGNDLNATNVNTIDSGLSTQ